MLMGHAYWGMQMLWAMRAPLHFVPRHRADFNLGRMWQRSSCPALQCSGRGCERKDIVLRRPWQPAVFPQPPTPRPATFALGKYDTRFGCSIHYFECYGASLMCQQALQASEPMDRQAAHSELTPVADVRDPAFARLLTRRERALSRQLTFGLFLRRRRARAG